MSDKDIRLKNNLGEILYPETKISNIVDKDGNAVIILTKEEIQKMIDDAIAKIGK